MTRKFVPCMLTIAAIVSFATTGATASTVTTHHVRSVQTTGEAKVVGRLPAGQIMNLDLVLPLRDQAGLDAFLVKLYTPGDPAFRQFITPQEFSAKFGPTQADYDKVVAFAKENGLTVTGGTFDGREVQVEGPVYAVEGAFHVNMVTYQHPTEGRTFFSPDREPTTSLPFPLWHVSGLDNFSIPHPLYEKKSDFAAAHGLKVEEVTPEATTGSGPSASFLGSDMRAAYYGGTALTGKGINAGLFEYEGTDLADLTTYYKNVAQTEPITPILLSTDGTATACVDSKAGGDCDDTEQTLDMTQILGMAPGLSSLVVYIGSLDSAIISAMTTHSPLPLTIGCSWGWTPADPTTLDPYFEQMSAQGQNFFAASGDSSTWSKSVEAWPADDTYIVSVGGTDLVTKAAAGPWSSETAWVDSGGGINVDKIAIPTWQKAAVNSTNKASSTLRNGPDVSANANFTFYTCADQTTCKANSYGGTSFAAPMWAGFVALADQAYLADGYKTSLGFINPNVYTDNATAATYAADFHDITSGKSGSYTAVAGYDLVTGWGSPTAALIGDLTAGIQLTVPNATLSVATGSTSNETITLNVTGSFDSPLTITSTGSPTDLNSAFAELTPTAGTGTASITIAAPGGPSTVEFRVKAKTGVKTGTYPIVITVTGGNRSATATVNVTVTAAS